MSKLCCSTDNNLNLVKKKEHKHNKIKELQQKQAMLLWTHKVQSIREI